MFKSHIKLMVLKRLDKEALSGYDLMKHLGLHGDKPSPGYIYPMLKDLQKNEFISVKEEGRRKIYSITQKGNKLLENLGNKQKEMMKTMAGIGDKKEMKEFMKLNSDMEKNNYFLQDRETFEELHKLIFKIYKDKNDEKRKMMKKVLNEAIKKLRNLR